MKKPLLIWVSALTLLASATLLFAQTTTGSSLITEMKAAVRVFTLAGDLNPPGTTGLQSAPVSGKKTGDMLTAGEWNRVLELVAQGGGGTGGFTTTIFRDVTNGYTGAASIKTYTCPGWQYVLSVSSVMIPSWQYSCANTPNVDKKSVSYNSCEPLAGQTWQTDIICGGGGGGGGPGWLKNCAPVQGTSATAVACWYTVNAVCPTGKVAISWGTYQAGNISLQNTSPILTGGKMTGWYVTYVASWFCPDFNANNPSWKVVNGERPCFPLTGSSVCGGATVVCCEE